MKNIDLTTRPICFFDSGIGGLNLLYECVCKLPYVDFVYFADNYNMPYGILPAEEILKRTSNIFSRISELNPVAAVLACNTVTARCAEVLRQKYEFPIIGIQPAIKPAASAKGKTIVLATPSTAKSEALISLVERFGNNDTEIIPCAELAGYIENNIFNLQEDVIYSLLPDVKAENVVLGCTHYGFIKNLIEKRYNCRVFDGVEGTSKRLCVIIENSSVEYNLVRNIEFLYGDVEKNKLVFSKLMESKNGLGEIFPKKSQ